MPEGSEVPGVAKTRAYEVVERWGYVFIWWVSIEGAKREMEIDGVETSETSGCLPRASC